MGFRLESEMTAPIRAWLSAQVDQVKREFRTPWGYCDFVGCSLNLRRVRQRLGAGQRERIGPVEQIDLLWQMPDEGSGRYSDLQQLMESYSPWATIDDVCNRIIELERRGFVTRDSQGRLQKRNGWFPLHKRLVAVEAKLSRVEESIWQAAKHLAYADESYVALPATLASRVARSSREKEFRRMGLGLLAVADAGVRVLVRSKRKGDADPVLQAYAVERFWDPHITDSKA